MTSGASLAALMAARSVAIVGASERADASSSFVLNNLRAHGFKGEILPINPRAKVIAGLRAAPRLPDLDRLPDAVVVAVAAEAAVAAIEEAASLGVRAGVVLASGFAETGDAGRALQERMAGAARAAGMALCGPNCLGLHVAASGLSLFSSTLNPDMRRGDVALLSHSGAGAITLANSGRIGVSHIVSAGNAAMTDIADFVGYLAGEGSAKVAALLIEQIADPPALAASMKSAHHAGLVVVAMRAGRSRRGARATAAHTGALAGSAEAYSAFFRRHGVIEAATYDELLETAALMSSERWRGARGAAALTGVSGGGLAHAADLAEEAGVRLADLSEETRAAIDALLPPFVRAANPLDMTGMVFGDPDRYRVAFSALDADPAVGALVAVQDAPLALHEAGAAEYAGIAQAIAAHGTGSAKPIAMLSLLAGGPHPAIRAVLESRGVPLAQGAAGMRAIGMALAPPAADPPGHPPVLEAGAEWIARLSSGPALTEREAKAFLAAHGLAVPRETLATDAEAAARAAGDIGFPVAMKIESPDIPHKTEAGGVRLGVANAAAARQAFGAIMASASAFAPDARLNGVVVQEMVRAGADAIVGVSRHPPFGLAMTVGPGGVLVEIAGGHAVDVLPLDRAGARRLIDVTKLKPLLDGYRGGPALDADALAALIERLGLIAAAYGDCIEAIDLNPVAVLTEGVRVLDALIVRRIDDAPARDHEA